MQIKPEELSANGYQVLDSLGHQDIIPFIRASMKKKTVFSLLYNVFNLIAALMIVVAFLYNYSLNNFNVWNGLTYLSYGLAIAFGLVPIHEYIHVLAYKSQGAIHTSYDANLKKFYFMAIADQFVANKKEFQIVALAPFTVISGILVILLLFSGQYWTFTILGVLLTHTAFCSGDFGLLSYFQSQKEMDVVTYDDKKNGISYFYGKDKSLTQ